VSKKTIQLNFKDMAYCVIPQDMQSEFVPLVGASIPPELSQCIFYEKNLKRIKNQSAGEENNNPGHKGFSINLAILKRPDGSTETCLAALSVTTQSGNGSWTSRRTDPGDFVALSCPRYEKEEDEIVII
jgi:hypothetical protein